MPRVLLWTIRHAAEADILERTGVLRASGRWAPRELAPAYRWMAAQLTARVGPPPARGAYPLWAWHRWKGLQQAKPDLRASAHLRSGQPGVRVAFELDRDEVLLSDFDAWHAVLNRHYLATSPTDEQAFERRLARAGHPPPAALTARIEQSWERIFDLRRALRGWREDFAALSIQATFWELRLAQVVEWRRFVAR